MAAYPSFQAARNFVRKDSEAIGMAAITKTQQQKSYRSVLIMSAWGHVIVILSFLFLYVGKLLDELAGTLPASCSDYFFWHCLPASAGFIKRRG